MVSEPLTLAFLILPSWKTFKWGYFEGRRGPLVSTWDVHCGNRDDLVFQGFWGLLSLSWVARKAGLYLLCGLSLKSGLTLIYSTALRGASFMWSLSLLEDKTIENFLWSWEDMQGIYIRWKRKHICICY